MNSVPLSKTIKALLDDLPEGQKITVNWMISNTGGRGIYLVFIWLSLPFVVPVSLPGFSVVVGLVFLCLCWSMLRGDVGRLPRKKRINVIAEDDDQHFQSNKYQDQGKPEFKVGKIRHGTSKEKIKRSQS